MRYRPVLASTQLLLKFLLLLRVTPQTPNYKCMPGKSKNRRHSTMGSEPEKWEASSLVDVANIPYSRSNRQV